MSVTTPSVTAKKAHSVKVPRLYKVAAAILRDHDAGKASVKTLVYESRKKHPNIKALMALVTQCIERRASLDDLFLQIELFSQETGLDRHLASILATELLWGKKALPGESRPVITLRKYESSLQSKLGSCDKAIAPKAQAGRPRYVRVNTLKASLAQVLSKLEADGMTRVKKSDSESVSLAAQTLGVNEFITDDIVDNLLVFPPKTSFFEHPLYKDGTLLLQVRNLLVNLFFADRS